MSNELGREATSSQETTSTSEVFTNELSSSSEGFVMGEGNEYSEYLTMSEAQGVVENVFDRTVDQIYSEAREYYTPENAERIESRSIKSIEAVPPDYSDNTIGSFRYNNGESIIEVCNYSATQVERTTCHETHHYMSNNGELRSIGEDGSLRVQRQSGIHVSEYSLGREVRSIEDSNRALNEGITQMYTNRHLEEVDAAKGLLAKRSNGYIFATEITEGLEEIVGEERIKEAYYGGNLDQLKGEINRLGGPNAFERLSKAVDEGTYARDSEALHNARREAHQVLREMGRNKMEEINNDSL